MADEQQRQIKEGDVVVLKTANGTQMVVNRKTENLWECVWQKEGIPYSSLYGDHALKLHGSSSKG